MRPDARIKYLEREFSFEPNAKWFGGDGPCWWLKTFMVTRDGHEFHDMVCKTLITELDDKSRTLMMATSDATIRRFFDKEFVENHMHINSGNTNAV